MFVCLYMCILLQVKENVNVSGSASEERLRGTEEEEDGGVVESTPRGRGHSMRMIIRRVSLEIDQGGLTAAQLRRYDASVVFHIDSIIYIYFYIQLMSINRGGSESYFD